MNELNNDEARSNLRRWMEENNYTVRGLARALDFNHAFISRILSGHQPMTDAVRWRLANLIGYAEAVELVGVTVEPEKEVIA